MGEITSCPACNVKLMLPESAMGLEVKCPHCQHVFRGQTSAIQEKTDANPGSYRVPASASREEHFNRRLDEFEDDGYRPVRGQLAGLGRAKAAVILLLITLFVQGIGMLISLLFVGELNRLMQFGRNPAGANLRSAQTLDSLHSLCGIVEIAVGIAMAVVFLMWIYSAYANLQTLGTHRLQYSPGWAVGYFFIPILNLFRPIQVVQEIWRQSDPQNRDSNSAMAGFWWACWLINGILGQISFRLALKTDATLDEIRAALNIGIASGFFYIIAGILLILLIRGIMQRQVEKFERLASGSEY
ncbi:MAG TPA: DUF4328 domain-containing protein [Gemmataceae bacterium]|nr:DUF4328 domain-containing protein [Gemmataceae bacterium]